MLGCALAALALAAAPGIEPPPADRVLVLVNDRMPAEAGTGGVGASVFVGQYYAGRRGIPRQNVFHLQTSAGEFIDFRDYKSQIEAPLKAFLEAGGGAMRKRILYIVPAYGVPVSTNAPGSKSSVDGRLAAMYAGGDELFRFPNPYAARTGSRPPRFAAWADQREAAGGWKLFIVSRLDGPSALIAKGLVDKALNAEAKLALDSGIGYFDRQGTRTPSEWQYAVDEEIRQAAALSQARGFPTVLHTQAREPCGCVVHPGAIHYYDAAARNVYVNAAGADAATRFTFPAVSEGDFTVGLKNQATQGVGNSVTLTLAASHPQTCIRLSYPLVPFLGGEPKADMVLEKVLNGTRVAHTAVRFDKAAEAAINGVAELRVSVRNGDIAVYRNGELLARAAGAGAAIGLRGLTVAARCWSYRLTGFSVSDTAGKSLWKDTFSRDTTANYSWEMAPAEGLRALWAWGWYSQAYDSYRFVEGAVGAQLTSYTALVIRKPVNPDPVVAGDGARRWGGNWVPRMLEEGVTATWGTVEEPYAPLYPAGGNVFDHLWSGYNFGESVFMAQPALRWTILAIGDPLYAPRVFAR